MRHITMMVQDEGMIEVEVGPSTTVQEVADRYGWNDYGFTVDDIAIARENWATTILYTAREVWAVKGAKGA